MLTNLEHLIESISSKIDVKIKTSGVNTKCIDSISIGCENIEIAKECLHQIEEYLTLCNYSDIINIELKKLTYYIKYTPALSIEEHAILLDSYNSCPLIKLLHIKHTLIDFLKDGPNNGPNTEVWPHSRTGSWEELLIHESVESKLNCFFGSDTGRNVPKIVTIQQQMEEELNRRLSLSTNPLSTNYFAFNISNGVFSEPYILKTSNGKIDEVIRSISGHDSTDLHSHLFNFIKKNNPRCTMYSTLPLLHDGDCTRYSYYALIQFQYLSELHGTDKAFALLSQKNPYECNKNILRDFQMLSYFCDYDPLGGRMYPLPEDIGAAINVDTLTKNSLPQYEKNHQIFNEQLKLLAEKITTLDQRQMKKAHGAGGKLYQELSAAGAIYFSNEPTSKAYDTFKNNCYASIKEARKELNQHRGWSEFLINLVLALTTLGTGLLIKGAVNWSKNRHFFFVHQTDSSKKIKNIEDLVQSTNPKP